MISLPAVCARIFAALQSLQAIKAADVLSLTMMNCLQLINMSWHMV